MSVPFYCTIKTIRLFRKLCKLSRYYLMGKGKKAIFAVGFH